MRFLIAPVDPPQKNYRIAGLCMRSGSSRILEKARDSDHAHRFNSGSRTRDTPSAGVEPAEVILWRVEGK
jgi:hypothetical protein